MAMYKEVEECSFKPLINDNSIRKVTHRPQMSRKSFERLFLDAKVKMKQKQQNQENTQVNDENCTFQPHINVLS